MSVSSPMQNGVQSSWNDGERIICREQRLSADGKLDDVLIVRLAVETSASRGRLANEFALKDKLDDSAAVRPIALVTERGQTELILKDPGGEPLEQLLDDSMDLEHFLRWAIAITSALVQLHRRGLVHKDIKPANILLNADCGEARFTGFGIASCLSRERQALEPPGTIAGTLAYMAPEQTGRMNRSVDSRSDLYALGVTLYQMLTGVLPFAATDPMGWVHCHVAKQAIPPAERVKNVPGTLSAIIMKLLAKTAEERYQTAVGLRSDLQRCLAAWDANRRVDHFRLGDDDKPDRLLIPEKLYGRTGDIKTLFDAFGRVVKSGETELVLISGYSGAGKTALVQELHGALISRGTLFTSGKFDQLKRDIPYAPLARAFQSLIHDLVAKGDADLVPWRDTLREALAGLGGLLFDLVPDLRLIIGDQPAAPEAAPQDAQRRFQFVLRRFIGVFAQPDHPLALFLDDLQWLDPATLNMLEDIMTSPDMRNLLLIGAYRDNEVTEAHPLRQKIDAIRSAKARLQEIHLAPLSRNSVDQFIADALRCEPASAALLAGLLHEKTEGNPFFLIQFLCALVDEELLAFDHDQAQWRWDLRGIQAKGYTENVADLMVSRLRGLPNEVQMALLGLACLGDRADAKTLALAHGISERQVHADLREAVRLQLIERQDDCYRFFHDRIQEAAYALERDDKAVIHLRIGIALAAHLTQDGLSEDLYSVANQLNRGLTAVTNDAERERIVAVNFAAGRRARKASAYNAAIVYLDFARETLADAAHPSRSPTALAIALLRAECKFLIGQLDVAEAELLMLSESCLDLQTSADVARLRAQLYTAAGQLGRAVEVCLEFLRLVGIDWCARPSRIEVDEERERLRSLAGNLADDELRGLPSMTVPRHRAMMAVLADLIIPASHVDRDLSDVVLLGATRQTIEHGICPESCFALTTTFGVLASTPADAELAFRLSKFGADLADAEPQFGLSGRALLSFGLHVTPWVRPIESGLPFMRRAREICLSAGDLGFVAYANRGFVSVGLFCGEPLSDVYSRVEQALAFARGFGLWLSADILAFPRRLTLGLMGRDAERSFEVPANIEPHPAESKLGLNAFLCYAAQIQLDVLAGRHNAALAVAELADKLSWRFKAYSEFTEYRFYKGLAHAAAYHASLPENRKAHFDGLGEQHRKFTIWSTRAPENFVARKTLLAAEIARIEGRLLDAEQLYEEAIQLAREAGFTQIEAIAAEHAARFYDARNIQTVFLSYLSLARDCYGRWGADAKVRQLNEIYPRLDTKDTVLNPGPTNLIDASVEQLDLATVLKISESISGEVAPDGLLRTLLRTAIEHAGAERGLLILPLDSDFWIRAEATTSGAVVAIGLLNRPASSEELPMSLVRYAARTLENVILDDASTRGAFAADAYIRRKFARSVLAMPLVRQGTLVALLYLENNHTPRVFVPARVAVLKFLASEAATSLDNARLYRELQERESRIRRLVDANIIGMYIFNDEGIIVDANQAFLRTVGYEREDLNAGRLRDLDLTPPEWLERYARAQTEMAMSGAVRPFETEYFRSSGSRVPVLIGSAAFDERRNQGVTFVLDLSERRRAEIEARDNERRYRAAQLELEHANRLAVLGHLTASIAHEVNQPNTAVVASAQAAQRWLDRREPELDQVRQALGRIIQNGMRASGIIERIRDLVKKKPPRKERLAINSIIREVVELTQIEAVRHSVAVRMVLAEGLPDVVGDRVELQQVAVNLILNAIEAMSELASGSRELSIRATSADRDGVFVAIADTGPGFASASSDRLFEPFYSTKSGGLGIGLSICSSIIGSHGGRLWASANQPQGAVFQFTLPIAGDDPSS